MTKAQQYLQRAAKNLDRAVAALEFDMKEFSRAVQNKEVEMKHQIQDLNSEIRREEVDLASNNGLADQVEAMKGVRDARKQIKQVEQDYKDFKAQHNQQVDAHKEAVSTIQGFANTVRGYMDQVSKDLPG